MASSILPPTRSRLPPPPTLLHYQTSSTNILLVSLSPFVCLPYPLSILSIYLSLHILSNMPSSLIDRSFYANSRRSSSQVDGLPSRPAETFSTLRMSIFEGLESHPAVDTHAVHPSQLPMGVEGLIRHPDAPKPFSLVEIFGESMARSASPVHTSSTASEFALALAERSSSLSPKSTSRSASEFQETGQVQGGYYEDDEYFNQDDYEEGDMADDEYYPSPPSSRIASSISTRASRFLNSSDFTPTVQPSMPSRHSKFLKHHQKQQEPQSSHEIVHLHAANPVPSVLPSPSISDFVSSDATTDVSSDSTTEDSDPFEGNNSSSEPEPEPHHRAFRPSHFLQPIFIPPSATLKGTVDDALNSAMYESSNLVAGLRSAFDGAFKGVSSFIGQGVSHFSQISSPSPQPSTWAASKTPASSLGPPGFISRILFDFFAAREQRRSA